jgi:hypothetical protein
LIGFSSILISLESIKSSALISATRLQHGCSGQ